MTENKYTGDATETMSVINDIGEGNTKEAWNKIKANLKRAWTTPKEVFNRVKELGTGMLTSVVTGNPVAAVKAGVNALFPGFFGPSTDELASRMDGFEKGLESLANHMGKALDGLRGEMQEALEGMGAEMNEIKECLAEFTKAQSRVNEKVQQQIKQIHDKLKDHDKDIQDNKEKTFKQAVKLDDVRNELKDQIRMTNTNVENLRKEQAETKNDFEKYKHQINEKTAKTEQAFDDLQSDYTRRNKIIETQINDNYEQLGEFQEDLANVEYQQKKLNQDYQEMSETLEEQVSLAYEQKRRLDTVVNEIDEIHEEFNAKINRLTQSQLEQDEKIDEAVFAAKRATRKVDELNEKLEKNVKQTEKLKDQIDKNKEETKKAKEEAKRANERIDNLLKNQQLLDHSKEQQTFDKLTKSLELKAEEAQLLASLELLKKTQKLITPAEREWRVGIEEGTEKDMPRPEGMPLKPDSSWAKKYTKEQLQEWGWDTRLLGDNETAPLTDEEKRKPEESAPSKSQTQEQEQSQQQQEQQKNLQEVIEETKSQLLEQLKEIQEQINENVSSLEEKSMAPREESESEDEEIEEKKEELEKKEIKILQKRAEAKATLSRAKSKQASLQQQKETKKAEIVKEQKNIKKLEQSIGNPSATPQQKKKQQENKFASEEKLTQLQKQLEKIEAEEKKQEKATEKAEEEVQKKEKELEKVQSQKPISIESKKIDKEIKDAEQKANQAQHEYVEQQWQEIKKNESQILDSVPEAPEIKDVDEKIQEIKKEMQSAEATPQKSMEITLLYFIIFWLEYIVYKRNGLPGLVVLNTILLICYWYREELREFYAKNLKQFGIYLLILGYVMLNVLAYSAPKEDKYRWPCLIGTNAFLLLVYGYTWWKSRKTIKVKQEELVSVQTQFVEETVQKEVEYIDNLQETQEILEKAKEKIKNSSTVNFSTLSQGVKKGGLFASEADVEQARKIYEKIKQKHAQKESDEHLISPEAQKLLKLVQESGTYLSSEEQELIQKIQTKQKELEYQKFSQLTNKVPAVQEELKKTLSKLLTSLTEEQITAISSQSPYLKDNQNKLNNVYSHLNKEEKLKLLNSGLDSLQINTLELKQELLNIRLATQQEERGFDLSVEEKEDILRLITSQVSSSQLKTYEEYGVPIYNASSWKITLEHKKSLINLAEDLISVENKEELFNLGRENLEKLPLSGRQEQILRTLAPLQKEYNYSVNLLNKLRNLPNRQFLTQREIIPLEHQKTSDPYKELKKRVLRNKYKEVSWEIKQQEKEKAIEKSQELRNSLLPSLLFFAQMNKEDLAYQEYYLDKKTFGEKEDWVSIGAINSRQRDLLYLSGFKLMPQYYFFDLLIFAVENIHQDKFIFDWERWKNISFYFTEELVREWVINGFDYNSCKEWVDIGMKVDKDVSYCAWISKIKKLTPEEVLNYEDEGLFKEYQEYEQHYLTEILLIFDNLKDKATGEEKEALKGVIKIISDENLTQEKQLEELKAFLNKFPSDNDKLNSLVQQLEKMNKKHTITFSSWNNFLNQYPNLKPEWEKYLELVKEREDRELQRKAEWLNSFTSSEKTGSVSALPNISHLEEKYERLASAYERMRDYLDSDEMPEKKPLEETTSQPTSSSPYDDLLKGLDQEEQARLKKKRAREEARKKLDEAEFSRRQANLSEKDRKMKEDEEKRLRDKELQAEEERKKDEAKATRDKNLSEERQELLDNQTKRTKEAAERAQKELEFKEQEAQKEKERREQEIKETKEKNEQNERKIKEKEALIKKELEEKLNEVAVEDEAKRQIIKEKYDKQIVENQKALNELKRKNDDETNTLKAQAKKKADEAEENLRSLRDRQKELDAEARRAKVMADAADRELEASRDKEMALDRYRKELYDEVMNYYFISSETVRGTRSPQLNYSGSLRSFVDNHPSIEFNLHLGDVVEANKSGSLRKAIMIFRKVAGNNFVNKAELRSLIEEKVNTLDFLK